MKKIFLFTFLWIVFQSISPSFAKDPRVEELSQQKMPELHEPAISMATLENGMKVYYLKDDELPILKVSVYFQAGSIHDTKEQRGLSDIFFPMLRNGGSKTMNPDEIDEKLEFFAASLGGGTGNELSNFGVECLMKDAEEILPIYFDLLKNPGFDEARLDVMKKSALNAIKRRNEEPAPIASREFYQFLYGDDSPIAWRTTPETIQAITPDTLNKYYKENLNTEHSFVAATSPLDFEDFLDLFKKHMGNFEKKGPAKTYPVKNEKLLEPGIQFIQKEGNQSSIMAGHFGEKRHHPDYYAIIVANELLGGSTFGSKLGDRIRTELGLTYGVTSGFSFDTDLGVFVMAMSTKSETTVQAIEEMRGVLKKLAEGELAEKDVNLAKERILNRMVFAQVSPYSMVVQRLINDYFGYPPDNIFEEQKGLGAVTVADVKAAFAKYFFADKLKIIIVGDRSKISDLNKLGHVVERPLDNE